MHLTKNGVVSLMDCTLLEDQEDDDNRQDADHLDFKISVEPKDSAPFVVILMASSRQEKAAWTSDISQVTTECHHFAITSPSIITPTSLSLHVCGQYPL